MGAGTTIRRMPGRVLAITHIHGVAGRREDLRALMRDTEARVVAEPGCRAYRFSVTLEDPDEYVNVQEWEDDDAFLAHQTSPAFREYQRGLFDLLARPSEMEVHRAGATTRPEPSVMDPRAAD